MGIEYPKVVERLSETWKSTDQLGKRASREPFQINRDSFGPAPIKSNITLMQKEKSLEKEKPKSNLKSWNELSKSTNELHGLKNT